MIVFTIPPSVAAATITSCRNFAQSCDGAVPKSKYPVNGWGYVELPRGSVGRETSRLDELRPAFRFRRDGCAERLAGFARDLEANRFELRLDLRVLVGRDDRRHQRIED